MTSPVSTLTIDLFAYAYNLRYVSETIPETCRIMAVVKADAYGLGAVPIAKKALESGAQLLAVATVEEGIALREAGIAAPILVLVQPQEDAFADAIQHSLRLMISSIAAAERLGEIARKRKKLAVIHCDVDTGMGRQGFGPEEALEAVMQITRISNVDIEGISTHFPTASDPNDPFTLNQLKVFRQLLRDFERDGVPFEMIHAANSAAIVNFPQAAFDVVRPGILLYGVWPSTAAQAGNAVRPVVRWTSEVVLLREIQGGASVGYGRTYKAPSPRKAALVPVGYADGFKYQLSNRGEVLIRGARCRVLGSVSMDQIVVDVTQVPGVAVGDTVTIIGTDGDHTITVSQMAQAADTLPYDILTGIGKRVRREYV